MIKLKIGIAGYGIVGKRRHQFISEHPNLKVVAICDQTIKNNYTNEQGVVCYTKVEELLNCKLDILFVCLTNNVAASTTITGLEKGMHVFCEKPPAMNVAEVIKVIEVEKKHPDLKLKYGFNHRYHDSVKEALRTIQSGELGEIINLRGIYGKSRLVTFSGGWRSRRDLAGGGILLDQGIHMVDLMRLFCGEFVEVKSFISNNFWKHDVEDNVYVIMKDKLGRVAMLNSSATLWQHKFSLEISLTKGYLELSGILSGSKSYGEEQIVVYKRDKESENGQMASKTIKFLQDDSWRNEIFEFAEAILHDKKIESGNSNDALETMKQVFSIYFSDVQWRKQFSIKNPNK